MSTLFVFKIWQPIPALKTASSPCIRRSAGLYNTGIFKRFLKNHMKLEDTLQVKYEDSIEQDGEKGVADCVKHDKQRQIHEAVKRRSFTSAEYI